MRIQKIVFLLLISCCAFMSVAFSTDDRALKDYKDFYIYVYCHDKQDHDKVYVSGMCHYVADDCGASYDWKPKLEKAFVSHVEANYSNADPDYIYNIGSTTGNYLSTTQQATEALNKKIAELKQKGHTVNKTNFTYGCNK